MESLELVNNFKSVTCYNCNREFLLSHFLKKAIKLNTELYCKSCRRRHKLCKNKLHIKPNLGRCHSCVKISRKRPDQLKKTKISRKIYYEKNKEKHKKWMSSYRQKNRSLIKLKNKEYWQKPSSKLRQKEYLKANPKQKKNLLLAQKKWRLKNLDKVSSYRVARRSGIKQQTLILSEEHKKQIKDIYTKAKKLTKKFKTSFHVDHIVPLQGKNVSGLHVPWNLQILSAKANLSKSNKFDIKKDIL